jgi:sensor histidine kinase YesM
MRSNLTKVSVHVIGWCLLFLVPFFWTYQTSKSFAPILTVKPILPIGIIGAANILLFYLNYFILIPKFLFHKRYFLYISTLLCSIFFSFLFSFLVFKVFGFSPDDLVAANPFLRYIRPFAQANAFLLLAITLVTSLTLAFNDRLKQAEREKFSAQIAILKSQINPHFLFNTLNNIYAIALDTSPKTAEMVNKLSDIMRYTMKDTQQDFVLLEEEINYVNNYIELHKIRLDKNVKLDYTINGNFTIHQIAPMLLIPFIENAFKHGVNPEQNSHIKIDLALHENELKILVINQKVPTQRETFEKSGLGIENTKHRLELIYPENHKLSIIDTEDEYSVKLCLNLND